MTTVDIDHLLRNDELQQQLDAAEQTGSLKAADLTEILEAHELDALEQDALYRELDRRGIELLEEPQPEEPSAPAPAARGTQETTTDALQLFLREAGRHQLLTAPQEVELAKKIEGGDAHAKQQMIQSNLRLVVSIAKNYATRACRFSTDPGGHARPDPRRREVRLAPRLQVLDLRDLVDPPGGCSGAGRQGADDPHAGPHRRAPAEDEPRRANTLDAARPRARR